MLLSKVYNVWAKKVKWIYVWWHWRLIQNLTGKLTCAFKNDLTNSADFHRLENSDFIKMVELNQNKNPKQPDRPDVVWKLCFTLEINEWAVKLGSFLQCSVHIFLGHDGCFWKINLRILWNCIMEKFQVKHGQCDCIIFPKFFPLKTLDNYQTDSLQAVGFFTFSADLMPGPQNVWYSYF